MGIGLGVREKKGQKGKRRKVKGVRLAEGMEEERFLRQRNGEEPQGYHQRCLTRQFPFHLIFKCHAFSCKNQHTQSYSNVRYFTDSGQTTNKIQSFTNPLEKLKRLKPVQLSHDRANTSAA